MKRPRYNFQKISISHFFMSKKQLLFFARVGEGSQAQNAQNEWENLLKPSFCHIIEQPPKKIKFTWRGKKHFFEGSSQIFSFDHWA